MVLSHHLRIACCVLRENSVLFPYSKSFMNQAWLFKMAGYRPHSFCVFVDLKSISVHECTKKIFAKIQQMLADALVNGRPFNLVTYKTRQWCVADASGGLVSLL